MASDGGIDAKTGRYAKIKSKTHIHLGEGFPFAT
jgi:hypothetical protein